MVTEGVPKVDLGIFLQKTKGTAALSRCAQMTKKQHPHRPSRPGKRHRGITFNKTVRVYTFPDFSRRQDISMLWYRKKEYRRIRQEMISTVVRIARGGHCCDTDEHCAYGLERMPHMRPKTSKRRKFISILSVLVEQDDQMDFGIYSPEALANIYSQCSDASRAEAARRGKAAAHEALRLQTSNEI